MCSSVSTWAESIAAATESLQEDPSAAGIQDAVDEVGEATRTFADDLEETDAPETAAVAALTTMGQQVSATVEELEQLDAGSELSDAFDNADACRDLRDER